MKYTKWTGYDETVTVQLFFSSVTWTKHCVCTFIFLSLGWWKCLLFSYNNFGVKTVRSCLCSMLSFTLMSLTENTDFNVDKQLWIYISLKVISLQLKISSLPDCVAIAWLWLQDHINIGSVLFCFVWCFCWTVFHFDLTWKHRQKDRKKRKHSEWHFLFD